MTVYAEFSPYDYAKLVRLLYQLALNWLTKTLDDKRLFKRFHFLDVNAPLLDAMRFSKLVQPVDNDGQFAIRRIRDIFLNVCFNNAFAKIHQL